MWVYLWNVTKSFGKKDVIRTSQPKIPITTKYILHLKDLQISDHDPKTELPVHVILGICDYTKIKTQERTRLGLPREPIAESIKFGWVIASPGQETGVANMLFSETSLHDYETLCSLDCLGIEERRDDKNYAYEEFKKQLERGPRWFCETDLR